MASMGMTADAPKALSDEEFLLQALRDGAIGPATLNKVFAILSARDATIGAYQRANTTLEHAATHAIKRAETAEATIEALTKERDHIAGVRDLFIEYWNKAENAEIAAVTAKESLRAELVDQINLRVKAESTISHQAAQIAVLVEAINTAFTHIDIAMGDTDPNSDDNPLLLACQTLAPFVGDNP